MKMVVIKIDGVVVDKDCYSLVKIREIEFQAWLEKKTKKQ